MNQLNSMFLLQSQAEGGGFSGMIMIVLMIVIFYFFMIRPQSKKQKEIKKAIDIEIAPNISIKVDKASVYPYQEPQQKDSKK